jgi:hypothetical protein
MPDNASTDKKQAILSRLLGAYEDKLQPHRVNQRQPDELSLEKKALERVKRGNELL